MGGMMQQQPFGPTGHDSTRVIFGAAAIGNVSQQEADQTMELIRAHGINHIDTAASYGDAELRLGPWMEAHRDEFFLATKTGERTRALAFEEHLRSLEQYPFDAVLLPYNYPMSLNAAYMAEFSELATVCAERGVALQTIKAITRGPWGEQQPAANTWYEPLTDQSAIDTAVAWVLGRDGVFLNSVGDIHLLPKVIDAAERFTQRPNEDQMRELHAAFGLEPLFV